LVDRTYSQVNKNCFTEKQSQEPETIPRVYKSNNEGQSDGYPIHQLQQDEGISWIVIDNNTVYDATNSYFEQIRQPNGDIYLKLVDIFSTRIKRLSRPEAGQQPEN
jgi:hypothetical protein